MSVYRRSIAQQRTQRWYHEPGFWLDCEFDEPETRVRKPNIEGMVVCPTEDFSGDDPLNLSLEELKDYLRRIV